MTIPNLSHPATAPSIVERAIRLQRLNPHLSEPQALAAARYLGVKRGALAAVAGGEITELSDRIRRDRGCTPEEALNAAALQMSGVDGADGRPVADVHELADRIRRVKKCTPEQAMNDAVLAMNGAESV